MNMMRDPGDENEGVNGCKSGSHEIELMFFGDSNQLWVGFR